MSKQKITTTQKKKLLDLLTHKPRLRAGKFSNTFTHQEARKEWEEIGEVLNSIPGAKKDWKAWRKTWQDILSKTKSKSASINKTRRGTGGGPPPEDSLDPFEEGVAALLHPHSLSGHAESVESTVIFEEVYVTPQNTEDSYSTGLDVQAIEDAAAVPPPPQFSDASGSNPMPPAVDQPPPTNGKSKKSKINMKSLLKEKVNLKKEAMEVKKNFYEAFIKILERQAKALEDISNTFQQQNNNNNQDRTED